MRPTDRRHGERERPAQRVEHGQRPEVVAPADVVVEAGFDDVGERGEIATSVREFDALWPRRRSRGIRESYHGFFVGRLDRQIGPSLGTLLLVQSQALRNSVVELPDRIPLVIDVVIIDNDRDTQMRCSVALQQAHKLLINDDSLRIGVIEDVRNVLRLQPIVDSLTQTPSAIQ